MTQPSRALSKRYLVRVIALLPLCVVKDKMRFMNFIRRRWRRILVFSLPFFVGLFLSTLAQLFMPTIFPILFSVVFGISAFVFGMTISNLAVVFFSFAFLVTAFIILFYTW